MKKALLYTEMLQILGNLNYPTTYTTISRYQRQGLLMLPDKSNPKKEAGLRSYFSPLAIVEIIVLFYLFKAEIPVSYQDGHFSVQKVERLTKTSIYYGRINFYHDGGKKIDAVLTANSYQPLASLQYHDLVIGEPRTMDYQQLTFSKTVFREKYEHQLSLPTDPNFKFIFLDPDIGRNIFIFSEHYLKYLYGTAYQSVFNAFSTQLGFYSFPPE